MKAQAIKPVLIASIGLFLLCACSFSSAQWEWKKATEFEQKGDHENAIGYYYRYLRKNSENQDSVRAAQKIYQIARLHSQDLKLVEKVLRHIILRSDSDSERLQAQEDLANHFFQRMGDYESAITQFHRFLAVAKDDAKKQLAQLKIAKSYFYMNNFYQARVELDSVIESSKNPQLLFEASLLKASVLQSEKKTAEAIETFTKILQDFPDRGVQEQVFLSLALAYEDDKQYVKAIEVLEKYKDSSSNASYIDEKIEKIRFSISQQPGARGRLK